MSELTIRLINIYAPNSDSLNFFKFIKEHIELSEHDNCLICGNFNLVLDPKKDCINYKNINNPETRSCLMDVMNTLDLNGLFRCLNYDLRRYAWLCKNPTIHARLDYVLDSANIFEFTDKCCIKPGCRSDHYSLIELTLTTCKFERGRCLWKFNCSFLKDKEYVIHINNLIDREKL